MNAVDGIGAFKVNIENIPITQKNLNRGQLLPEIKFLSIEKKTNGNENQTRAKMVKDIFILKMNLKGK